MSERLLGLHQIMVQLMGHPIGLGLQLCGKTYGSGGCALFFQTVTSQQSLRRKVLSTARYEATFMMAMHPNFRKKSV